MIEIDLLPKELRRKEVDIPIAAFIPVVVVVVGIHLLLGISSGIKQRSLATLEEEWRGLQPGMEIAEGLTNELTTMRGRIDAIDNLIQGRMSWAMKFSDLSDAMIPGVWLNKLWLEQKITLEKMELGQPGPGEGQPQQATRERVIRTLHIDGSAIATGGGETAAIGKFIKSLKNNDGFFSDFKEVETTSIQRSRLKDIEVMEFELICYFKD